MPFSVFIIFLLLSDQYTIGDSSRVVACINLQNIFPGLSMLGCIVVIVVHIMIQYTQSTHTKILLTLTSVLFISHTTSLINIWTSTSYCTIMAVCVHWLSLGGMLWACVLAYYVCKKIMSSYPRGPGDLGRLARYVIENNSKYTSVIYSSKIKIVTNKDLLNRSTPLSKCLLYGSVGY